MILAHFAVLHVLDSKSQIHTLFSIIRNLMSKISLYVWGLGFGVWSLGFWGVVGGLVGCTYTHLLIFTH